MGIGSYGLLGTEISTEAVQRAIANGVETNQVDLNTTTLPYPNDSIDIVLFMEVIEHLYISDPVMQEVMRILRPGGLLVLTTPNLASWANRTAILFGFQPFSIDVSFKQNFGRVAPGGVNGHLKAFTRSALKEYLACFGFQIIAEGTTVAGGVRGLTKVLDLFLSHFPSLASHIMLGAMKRTP